MRAAKNALMSASDSAFNTIVASIHVIGQSLTPEVNYFIQVVLHTIKRTLQSIQISNKSIHFLN